MSTRPQAEELFLQGPAGKLESLLEVPNGDSPRGGVVICHPHPQHGGTMQNKVAHTIARAFVASGFAALRFNFRGIGKSEGEFDDGNGEVDDALAAVRAVRERTAGSLWIAGFSFGAAIAIRAAAEASADGLVSIAPAIGRVVRQSGEQPQCPWLIIQGDSDDLVHVDDTIAWVNELQPGPELKVFPDTEHFFHGKLVPLREAIQAFVDAREAST